MLDIELSRARRFAGVIGFFCAAGLAAHWFLSSRAFFLLATPTRRYLLGRPMSAITAWTALFYEHLPSSSIGQLVLLFGVCLLVYVPLFFAVCRARSVAWIALLFSSWLGVLLIVDLLFLSFVALGWAWPIAYPIEPLRP